MKYFTIISSILLVLLMAGTLLFVGMSPDFVAPGGNGSDGAGEDDPVWDMKMDDLLNYMEEKGFVVRDEMSPISAGVGTEAWGYNSAEFYWWDVDNLEEGSNEAAAWEDMNTEGVIDLWQQGTMFMAITPNGPFGMSFTYYTGDAKALLEAFLAFGREDGVSGDDSDNPVWTASLDELMSYMGETGLIDVSTALPLTMTSTGSLGYVCNGAEFYWWDLEGLAQDDARMVSYRSARDDQIIDMGNGYVIAVTTNGPFGLFSTYYEGDVKELTEAFEAFGH